MNDTLTINGIAYDFSVIPDGATLPASAVGCEYITWNVGLLLDLIVNTTAASTIFLGPPKKWTVSARLTRHSESAGWRQRVAIAIRSALLDNIDPNGVHRG
jgi:hypothetical protein